MTATPAEVANDLEAQAAFFVKRDDDVSRLCREAARLIRQMLAGEQIDGRTWGGVHRRLCDRIIGRDVGTQIGKSLSRGLDTLTALRAATS
jgi:hypothetical protein